MHNNPYKNIYIYNHLIYYPTPSNINYFWGAGSMSGIFLGIQILTGVFLAMYYTPHVDYAFISVEHIMRDVQYGWFIRYVHANGASFFFILVYLHIARNLYYGSYIKPRTVLWLSGITILLLMMATAFLGYVLPWGQMSFWGATVITNLFSVIPFIGLTLVEWLWGGFSVNNATLNKFFSLHFLLPFTIIGMVLLHLLLLHKVGSNNPLGIINNKVINFYPYFYIKDLFVFFSIFFLFLIIVCYYPNLFGHPDNYIIANSMVTSAHIVPEWYFLPFYPNLFGHPDNYIIANSMVTSAHIVPEWYFLPFYAILRSVPDKLGGVLAMGGSIVLFYFLPLFNCYLIRSTFFKPFYNILYWFFIMNFCLLGWLGQMPIEEDPYGFLGQLITFFYFLYFIIIIFLNAIKNSIYKININNKNNVLIGLLIQTCIILFKRSINNFIYIHVYIVKILSYNILIFLFSKTVIVYLILQRLISAYAEIRYLPNIKTFLYTGVISVTGFEIFLYIKKFVIFIYLFLLFIYILYNMYKYIKVRYK